MYVGKCAHNECLDSFRPARPRAWTPTWCRRTASAAPPTVRQPSSRACLGSDRVRAALCRAPGALTFAPVDGAEGVEAAAAFAGPRFAAGMLQLATDAALDRPADAAPQARSRPACMCLCVCGAGG
jgi:hypothetical protein